MGLSVLKWAYNLGVKHERRRIAAILRNEAMMVARLQEQLYYPDGIHSTKPTDAQLQTDLAVFDKIRRLINNLFESHNEILVGESLMFPKEEK